MRVLIMYEHISREGDEIIAIAKALRSQGVEVRIYSVFFQYTKAILYALRKKCDVLVLPWMPTDKYYNFMGWIINSNPDIIIVNLAHEEIASNYSLPALIPKGFRPKECTIHFVWGEYYASLLEEAGVPKRNIVITGNGRTDFINVKSFDKRSAALKYGLNQSKKWILFAESRGFVYLNEDVTLNEHVRRGIDYNDSREYYFLSKQSLEATIDDFNSLGDAFFEKYELIYRPHPGTFVKEEIDNRIKIISEGSIYDWLHVVDANIVWSSTTIFESDAVGIPSIVCEPIDNNEKFRTFGTDRYLKIRSLKEITDELLKKALSIQKKERVYEDFYGIIDGHRCQNIADNIMLLSSKTEGYKALPSEGKYSIKKLVRLFIFEKVSYVFAKLGLIKVLKWPHMAYNKHSDIPWVFGKDIK